MNIPDAPNQQWRLLLTLFRPDETIWIGNLDSYGDPYFRTAEEW